MVTDLPAWIINNRKTTFELGQTLKKNQFKKNHT
jgi:hypothetical protein